MSETATYVDLYWSGGPAAMTEALTALGHPGLAPEGATPDPRVAMFVGPALLPVGGREVMFALLRLQPGAEVPTPADVSLEPGAVAEAALGVVSGQRTTLPLADFLLRWTVPVWYRIEKEADARAARGDFSLWGLLAELKANPTVNVANPRVIAGVRYVQGEGLITAELAATILAVQ